MQDSPDIGKVVLIGPCGPQRGVPANFTQHLAVALRHRHPSTQTLIAATTMDRHTAQPPALYCTQLDIEDRKAYAENARYLSSPALGVDVVSLQHHYSLYGGSDGSFILSFLDELAIPVVTTLHQVRPDPSRHLALTTEQLMKLSDRVVVTRQEDRIILETVYGATPERIDVIPLPASSRGLRNEVAAAMSDGAEALRPDRGSMPQSGPEGDENSLWGSIAELYNQSFVKAIIDARSAKRSQPWPWVHQREFAVKSGLTPGWDE